MEHLSGKKLSPVFYPNFPEVMKCTKHTQPNHPEKGSKKSIFQYCSDSNGYLLYLRAIQGHSGGNKVDPSEQDNVKIPHNWIHHIRHVGSSHDFNSRTRSGLIAGGKDSKEGRQTVFFTAVDLMKEPREDEPYDVTKPREVPYRLKWKVYRMQSIGSI